MQPHSLFLTGPPSGLARLQVGMEVNRTRRHAGWFLSPFEGNTRFSQARVWSENFRSAVYLSSKIQPVKATRRALPVPKNAYYLPLDCRLS